MLWAYKFIKGVFIPISPPASASVSWSLFSRPRSESLGRQSSSCLGFLAGDQPVGIEGLLVSPQTGGGTGRRSGLGRPRRGAECRGLAIEPWETGEREGRPVPTGLSQGLASAPKAWRF